jgi:E3 ubiquitin-protein ligase RNF115/126
MSESASPTETRAQRLSILVPVILDTVSASQARNSTRTRLVLLDRVARSFNVFDLPGDLDEVRELEALFGDLSEKRGPLPASRVSIEAMPRVAVTEKVAAEECAICLEGYEVGGEAREMPCKHMFHSGCIERWLGLRGSCPVCRFVMPVEEGNVKSGGGEGGERGFLVALWIGGGGDPMDVGSGTGRGSVASDSDGSRGSDEVDDASTQDMQF